MITSPKLSNYRNASLISFLNNVVSACNDYDKEALKINTEVAKIATDVQSLEALYSLAKKSANSESIESLDARRDAATLSIQGIAECYSKHYEQDYRDAAKVILNTFSKYGKGIARQAYRDQTATLQRLVNDFENDVTVSTALSKLHLTAWGQELKTANVEFEEVFKLRNKELTSQPDQNVKDVRNTATENYRRLIDVLKAFNTINPNGDYDKLLKEINGYVLKFNV